MLFNFNGGFTTMGVNSLNCIAKQNFDLLGFVDENKDNLKPFNEVLNNFKYQYKLDSKHSFQNQYAMASLLYCLLVMREQNKNIGKIPDVPIESLNSRWCLQGLKLLAGETKEWKRQCRAMTMTLSSIVDQMRHAIAHGKRLEDVIVFEGISYEA